MLATALVVGLCCRYICGFSGPAALVIGNGLALSSTAVVLQVTIPFFFLSSGFSQHIGSPEVLTSLFQEGCGEILFEAMIIAMTA